MNVKSNQSMNEQVTAVEIDKESWSTPNVSLASEIFSPLLRCNFASGYASDVIWGWSATA